MPTAAQASAVISFQRRCFVVAWAQSCGAMGPAQTRGRRAMTLKIPVRYLAMHNTDRGDVLEENIRYRETEWDVDPRDSAFVLVDFWSTHILRSHLERYTEITERKAAPLVDAARRAGFTIVHAPGFTIAKRYPQWEAYAEEEDREPPKPPKPDWPPETFRKSEGPHAKYAKPFFTEDLLEVGKECYEKRMILQAVAPRPEDYVVASGGQLHRLLTDKRILHLFYLGFSTDGCVQDKDYGTKAMAKRGYGIILVRDCTTGKETAHTLDRMLVTWMAVQQIELYHASTTSDALLKACGAADQAPA